MEQIISDRIVSQMSYDEFVKCLLGAPGELRLWCDSHTEQGIRDHIHQLLKNEIKRVTWHT